MIPAFRIIAILEGISYLLIFGVTMPLKYLADIPEPNMIVGMIHGFLFITYVLMSLIVWRMEKWSLKTLFIVLIASLLPFATFYIEKKYLNQTKHP